jgi:hypothetical protein
MKNVNWYISMSPATPRVPFSDKTDPPRHSKYMEAVWTFYNGTMDGIYIEVSSRSSQVDSILNYNRTVPLQRPSNHAAEHSSHSHHSRRARTLLPDRTGDYVPKANTDHYNRAAIVQDGTVGDEKKVCSTEDGFDLEVENRNPKSSRM